MLSLSSTFVYDSYCIFQWTKSNVLLEEENVDFLSNFITLDPKELINTLVTIKLVYLDKGKFYSCDQVVLSSAITNDDSVLGICSFSRILIKQYIMTLKPAWSGKMVYGRHEMCEFLSEEEKRCFLQAFLLDRYDRETIQWWDEISDAIRAENGMALLSEGRIGELLTIEYEKKRTGKSPLQVSIDSNLLGYDILSVTEAGSTEKLFIECKTSEKELKDSTVFVSSNEWDVAKSARNYLFYIWQITGNIRRLIIVTPKEMSDHIPENNGGGSWVSVQINVNQLVSQCGWAEKEK